MLKAHGKAAAEHVVSFEARQVSEVRGLIEQEGIDCDFEETTVTDVCTYSEGRDAVKASLSEVAKAGISTAKEIQYFEGEEACEVNEKKTHSHVFFEAQIDPLYRCPACDVQSVA